MRLLAIDTAGATGSVALAQFDECGVSTSLGSVDLPPRTFSVRLLPAIAELLQQNHIALADVDGLVVVHGPGSFTGMRVSLSTVKGIAEATSKPVIALSRLAVMASCLPQANQVHAILDAGRGEFYLGLYQDAGWKCVQESLATAESLREILSQEIISSGACVCVVAEDSVAAALAEFSPKVVHPFAADVFSLAWRCWQQQIFADVSTLDANYLRRTDVELFAKSQPAAATVASR